MSSPNFKASNVAEIYESHLVPLMFLPFSEEILGRLGPRTGERVLDVACGTGIVARQLAPLVGKAVRVVGLDPSPAMLAVARARPATEGAAIEWVEAGAQAMPLPDGAFDLVTCQQGLQFMPDKPAALREMRRVAAPGGRLGLAVWERVERQPFHAALETIIERRVGVRIFETGFSLGGEEVVRPLLEGAGWRDVRVDTVERSVHAPSAETLVWLHVMGAAAALPELQRMSPAEMDALIAGTQADAGDLLARYAEGEGVAYPMRATVATATA